LGAATGNQVQAVQIGKAKIDDKGIVDAFERKSLPVLPLLATST
jgi:hypothetical protein